MADCFFCGKPLNGSCDFHHPVPVRFTKTKRGHKVRVHRHCHERFNKFVDRSGKLEYQEYIDLMRRIGWGQDIYREAR